MTQTKVIRTPDQERLASQVEGLQSARRSADAALTHIQNVIILETDRMYTATLENIEEDFQRALRRLDRASARAERKLHE